MNHGKIHLKNISITVIHVCVVINIVIMIINNF